jgi:hypothetical protein
VARSLIANLSAANCYKSEHLKKPENWALGIIFVLSSCKPLARIMFIIVLSGFACVLYTYSEAQILKMFVMLCILSNFRVCVQMMLRNRYVKHDPNEDLIQTGLVTAVSLIQNNTSAFMFGFTLATLIFCH